MNLAAYTSHKRKGIEWLGAFPSHWDVKRLRFATERIEQGWSPQCDNQAADDDAWGVMKVGCVNGDQFDASESKALPPELDPKTEYELRPGDVLISRANTRELVGSAAIVPSDVRSKLLLCDKLFRIALSPQVDASYLTYCLRTPAARFQYEQDATGASGSMQNIGQDAIKNLVLPFPSYSEQQQIAAFLDWKTSQIDALIAKKQTLLQKLKEKRLAVITQAVTKGLNPDAPMRDSGIAWLGEVPAHWKLPALALRYKVELGKMLDEKQITKRHLIPYLRNVDVQWGKINFEDLPEMDISPHEYSRYTIEEGDVLVCEGGEVGRAAIVGSQTSVFGFQKALHRLRATTSEESPQFIFYTMMWAANTGVFNEEGNSTIAHLTAEKLRRYRFPQPPLAEQAAIVERLGIATEKIRRLLDKAESAITRLTEYRSALITAATTGKIDVRGWQAPQETV